MKKPIIVAEIGASHGQNILAAKRLILAAANIGANAVKFQTYQPETIAANVLIEKGPWAGKTYHDLYREAMLPREWHAELFACARASGLVPFSSPFSEDDVAFLKTLNCPWYKIASPEITHLDLIEAVCKTGKPIIISVNESASYQDISYAVRKARRYHAHTTLLICVSDYPAQPSQYQLGLLEHFRREFLCDVGISDHTRGTVLPVFAASLGADMIERHITITNDGHPDACFASPVSEFEAMVREVRRTEATRGGLVRALPKDIHRRCIWTTKSIKQGERITRDNVAALRPFRETGFPPWFMADLTSTETYASRDLEPNEPLTSKDVS